MLENKKVIIFDMDGTLIDSVGVWNEIDADLVREVCANNEIAIENIQKDRDCLLRQCNKSKNLYLEYCAFLKEKYNSSLLPQEIHSLRYKIAEKYLKDKIDYKKDADILDKI